MAPHVPADAVAAPLADHAALGPAVWPRREGQDEQGPRLVVAARVGRSPVVGVLVLKDSVAAPPHAAVPAADLEALLGAQLLRDPVVAHVRSGAGGGGPHGRRGILEGDEERVRRHEGPGVDEVVAVSHGVRVPELVRGAVLRGDGRHLDDGRVVPRNALQGGSQQGVGGDLPQGGRDCGIVVGPEPEGPPVGRWR